MKNIINRTKDNQKSGNPFQNFIQNGGIQLPYVENEEGAERNIGKKVTYLPDTISIDNNVIIKNPRYDIAVVPVIDTDRSYIEKMPTLKDLGIKGEYFVYVVVPSDRLDHLFGEDFYVKDNETLIVSYEDVYYELKRISFYEYSEETRW